jgi:hypothetical protein
LILIKAVDSAPKFPMPANWEYLLQYHHPTDNPKALKAVTTTLDNMALAGFMINWVADSPVILQMKTGWCPILKKCFMTMPN